MSGPQREGAADPKARGEELFRKGSYTEALVFFRQAVERDPNDDASLYNLGLCEERSGHYAEAINWYDRGLVLNLNNKELWLRKGVSLHKLGRSAEAKRSLERALHFDPGFIPALTWLGRVAIAGRKYDEALEALDDALAIDPGNGDVLFSKGVALSMGFGRFGEALGCYVKALEADPGQVGVLMEKGVAHRALAEFGEAVLTFRRVLEFRPDDEHALRYLRACEAKAKEDETTPGGMEGAAGGPEPSPATEVDWDEPEDADDPAEVAWDDDAPQPGGDNGGEPHPPRRIKCPGCGHVNTVEGGPGMHDIQCIECGAQGRVRF